MSNIYPYRLRFEKRGKMRFLSHHELMRLLERSMRRSEVPIRMTEGFNPHPILSFPTALGIGIESTDEIMEFELSAWESPKKVSERLAKQLPEGIKIRSLEPYARRDRSYVEYVEYEIAAPGQTEGMEKKIGAFLDQKSHVITRNLGNREKKVDIRPYVMAVEVEGDQIYLRIQVTDAGTARPDEVIRGIGVSLRDDVQIRKTYSELRTR